MMHWLDGAMALMLLAAAWWSLESGRGWSGSAPLLAMATGLAGLGFAALMLLDMLGA